MPRAAVLLVLPFLAAACVSSRSAETPPWDTSIPRADVSAVLLEEWSRADNRDVCAPVAFDPAAIPKDATPRRANFSGGWAVAWDQPGQPGRDAAGSACARCGRGAFGLAGTGGDASEAYLAQWEHQKRWPDGSWAGWGPEGHQGPRYLAYVKVAGESCLYNVWSSISREHLEGLLASLRSVETVP